MNPSAGTVVAWDSSARQDASSARVDAVSRLSQNPYPADAIFDSCGTYQVVGRRC